MHAEPPAGQVRRGPLRMAQRPLRRLQRLAEFVDHQMALDHALAHRGIEQPHQVAPGGLGLVERDVGLLQQQGCRAGRPRPRRHAEAGAHLDAQVLRCPRLAQRGQHRQRQRLALDGVHRLLDQQRKFVAAQPRQHAAVGALVHAVLQAPGDFLQQPVADQMAEVVVDRLEVVQVEQVERQRAERFLVGGLGRLAQRLGGRLGTRLQHMAVGQAGERVRVGQQRQFARLLVQLRHIAHHAAPADMQPDLVAHRHAADRPPHRPPHGAAHLHLHAAERCLPGQTAHQPDEVGGHLRVRPVAETLLHGQRRPALAEAQQTQQRFAQQGLRRGDAQLAGHALGRVGQAAFPVSGPAPGVGLGLEVVQQQRRGLLAAGGVGAHLGLLPALARQHEPPRPAHPRADPQHGPLPERPRRGFPQGQARARHHQGHGRHQQRIRREAADRVQREGRFA